MTELGVEDALTVVRRTWPDEQVTGHDLLDGSDRTVVARVRTSERSVVVKLHRSIGFPESLVREPAALSVVREGLELLGVSTEPPGVLLGDLGTGTDVATALLGDDPDAAADGIRAWAEALGRLQAANRDESSFGAALTEHAARLGQRVPAVDAMPEYLATTADRLAALAPELGVVPTERALEELRGLDGLLGGQVRALTPSDACPDNNLWTSDGLVLLDFEGAQVRHVAWDAAYLRVPWPSCWCCWRLPQECADRGLQAWKDAFADPYVLSASFAQDLDIAHLGWVLTSAGLFLRNALDGVPQTPEEAAVMPAQRVMLQHRLLTAPVVDRLPALALFVTELAEATQRAWAAEPLALAPSFR